MNIFREDTFGDEESVQADRLAESLDLLLKGQFVDIDAREDPELSELLVLASKLSDAGAEATSQSSFNSFRTRSRAALLQRLVENRSQDASGFWDSLRLLASNFRGYAVSAGAASLATLAIVFGASGLGESESSDPEMMVSMNQSGANSTSSSGSVAQEVTAGTMGIAQRTQQEDIQFGDKVPVSLQVPITAEQGTAKTVEVVNAQPYRTTVGSVRHALLQIESAGSEVSVNEIRELTAHLAQLGFDIRLNPPGNNNPDDVQEFQDAIAESVFLLGRLQTENESLLSAILAAKVVAEDSMGIATRYVNLNLASR